MSVPLRLLLVEDSEEDASLLIREILRDGFDVTSERVETPEAMLAALEGGPPDLVVSDYVMPRFSGLAALKLIQEKGLDLPFIIVSGKIGEDLAVEAMKAGAHDYLLKDHLSRLVPAIRRELQEAEVRRERKQAEEALQQSEERFRTLFENAPMGIVITRNGSIMIANQIFLDMHGLNDDTKFYNTPIFEYIAPDYRQEIAERIERRKQGKALPKLLETVGLKQDGSTFPAFVEAAQIDLPDGPASVTFISDITQIKQAEKALKKSEEKYRALVENLNDAIFTANAEGDVTYISSAIERIAGYKVDEITGQRLAHYVHPEDLPGVLEELERTLTGQLEPYEFRILKKDGTVCHVHTSSRVLAEDGKLSLIGVLTDITDRKQAEETLNKYQLLSEHTRDIMLYVRHRDGRIVEANNAAVKTYGYLREELLNMSIYDICAEEAYQMIDLQMEQEDKRSILFETLHLKKEGSIFPVEVSSQGITINNERIILSIVRDITLRRQQEAKLLLANEVFENNLSGILVTSREGVIQRANPAFTKITGYSEEEVIGKDVSILGYDTQYNSRVMQALSHANSYCGKAWNRSKDGTLFLEGFSINAIKDNEGQVLQSIKSFLDITEEEEIRKERQRLLEQKARIQRLVSLSALSAGIVHEISQPLNTIKLLADGMIYLYSKEDIFKLDEFIDNLKNISEQADQINVIINQMRSFANAGRTTESIPCNVNSAIKKITDILGRQLSAHGIILKTELEKSLPEVLGTPSVFEEVALNLIANSMHAFDAVGKPEKQIMIRTHLMDNKVVIEVSDNATGISEDIKDSIFEPLFSTKKTDEGMGLGLSIVQSIMERFNGRIEVQNNIKGGATFMLTFPVAGDSISE